MTPNSPSSIRGNFLYVVFLAGIAAITALATDMYLAAIPRIATQWNVPRSRVNLSLVLFFVAFSAFLLIWGSLSDKVGRKPVLVGGLGLFTAATFLCATADNVAVLITFRVLQGIGAASPSAMSMAICRDKYEGIQRQHVLAYISIILSVVPMLAPSIGALVLKYASWRFIFIVQGSLASLALLASLGYRETAEELFQGKLGKVFVRYRRLVANREYLLSTSVMGLIVGPFYGFIAFSPIAYISIFGLSEKVFGFLFGVNAFAGMLGAFSSTRLSGILPPRNQLTLCFAGCAAGGLGLLTLGSLSPLTFSGFMLIVSYFCGMSRPLSNHLILEQVSTDIGAAASFIVFYQFLVGALCMGFVSHEWAHPLRVFGLTATTMPLIILTIWPGLIRRLRANGTLKG